MIITGAPVEDKWTLERCHISEITDISSIGARTHVTSTLAYLQYAGWFVLSSPNTEVSSAEKMFGIFKQYPLIHCCLYIQEDSTTF